jgi:hypothetical protein
MLAVLLSRNVPHVDSFEMMQSENKTYFKGHIQCQLEMFLYFFISVVNQIDAQNFCFTINVQFCASSWLTIEINILRCTVSKMSKKVSVFVNYYNV